MRTGPPRGETATLEITVTDDMVASVGDRKIHPVYGTVALVGHIEQLCRTLLEPHLDPGEEGVGYAIEARHRAPVPVGTAITLTATVAKVGPHELTCEVLARRGTQIVARGSFEQRVVDAGEFSEEVQQRADA